MHFMEFIQKGVPSSTWCLFSLSFVLLMLGTLRITAGGFVECHLPVQLAYFSR